MICFRRPKHGAGRGFGFDIRIWLIGLFVNGEVSSAKVRVLVALQGATVGCDVASARSVFFCAVRRRRGCRPRTPAQSIHATLPPASLPAAPLRQDTGTALVGELLYARSVSGRARLRPSREHLVPSARPEPRPPKLHAPQKLASGVFRRVAAARNGGGICARMRSGGVRGRRAPASAI